MRRLLSVLTISVATAAGFLTATGAPAAATETTAGCISSIPDQGTTAPVNICYTLFKPASAATSPVPMVLHSHGWGGTRTTDPATFAYLLDAGFGVLSFDQRGFGESGGKAQIENPDVEGKDVQKLVDLVTALDWVKKEKPGDPVLGAIGGSYGGGYQFLGAFTELRDRGETRFDALVPEITWNSLTGSLFPEGVPRAEWATALTAASLPSDALPPAVIEGFVSAAATGNVPPSLVTFLEKNGPAWHVSQGRKLDIPVLFGQGGTDNLFPLSEGMKNFRTAITSKARSKSIFVSYVGGHNLPSLLPFGTSLDMPLAVTGPCPAALGSAAFSDLGRRFLERNLMGKATGLTGFGKYHLAAVGGRCVTVSDVAPNATRSVADVITTVGVGVPVAYPIAKGPLTVAGMPTIDASISTIGLDNRAFVALSVGTSRLDARIVQNNMLPIRQTGIVTNKARTGMELPAVAVDVPANQKLFLTVTPISDMSAGFGSRVVGAMTLRNVKVNLPLAP